MEHAPPGWRLPATNGAASTLKVWLVKTCPSFGE
jgi:hypothetical protein